MDREDDGVALAGDDLDAPGVGTHRDHTALGEVFGPSRAEPGLALQEGVGIALGERLPTGMEQHHVALGDLRGLPGLRARRRSPPR